MTNPLSEPFAKVSLGLLALSHRLSQCPTIETSPLLNLTELVTTHLSNPYIPGVILQAENTPQTVLLNLEFLKSTQDTINLIPGLLSDAVDIVKKQQATIQKQAGTLKLGAKMLTEISELTQLHMLKQCGVIALASLGTALILYGVHKKNAQQTQPNAPNKEYRFLGWAALGVCLLTGSMFLANKNNERALTLTRIAKQVFKPSS